MYKLLWVQTIWVRKQTQPHFQRSKPRAKQSSVAPRRPREVWCFVQSSFGRPKCPFQLPKSPLQSPKASSRLHVSKEKLRREKDYEDILTVFGRESPRQLRFYLSTLILTTKLTPKDLNHHFLSINTLPHPPFRGGLTTLQ